MANPLNPPADYESRDRVSLLRGAITNTLPPSDVPVADPLDPSTLIPLARKTLADVMADPGEEAKDRINAADSVLDRYAEPRRKFDMGGSKTVNIQLPPEAMTSALGALANVFARPKGEIIDLESPVPPALPSRPLLSADDQQGADPH